MDWGEVYRLAEEQSVLGLVAAGIEELRAKNCRAVEVPQEWALQFIGQTLQIEQRNQAMNAFLEKLISELRAKGVYTLLMKGQGVAQCYERPLWRMCGDVDLLLSNENYEAAKRLLVPLASSIDEEQEKRKHLALTIEGWTVELHGTLRTNLWKSLERMIDKVQGDVFYGGSVRSWMNGRTQVFLMGVDEDAVFVFVHILQHFFIEGIGLRQICDWCRLLYTYRESLNHGLLEQRINRAGLMSEWRAFTAVAVDYLGMPSDAMPFYDKSTKWNRKAKRIVEFVMMSGNMGHNRDSWLRAHDSWLSRQFVVRKSLSMFRRVGDLVRHARIFPLDSLRFSFTILKNGVMSAVRGEG